MRSGPTSSSDEGRRTGKPAAQGQPIGRQPLLHPVSGLGVLLLDWLIFGGNAATAAAATPVWMLAGFALTALIVYLVERRLAGRATWESAVKAVLCGTLVGLPFPVAGTAAGTLVLSASGLRYLSARRLLRPRRSDDETR